MKEVNVLIVASPGGHMNVARELFSQINHDVLYVTTQIPHAHGKDTLVIRPFGRDYRLFLVFFEAFALLWKYRPKIIFSSGAGIAVPFFIIGKLFGMKLIFVESASSVNSLSLSGRIVKPMANRFYIRDADLEKKVILDNAKT